MHNWVYITLDVGELDTNRFRSKTIKGILIHVLCRKVQTPIASYVQECGPFPTPHIGLAISQTRSHRIQLTIGKYEDCHVK